MPTINDVIEEYDELFYVKSGFDRFTKDSLLHGSNPVTSVYNQPVVPIYSDPTSVDSDGDGGNDYYEKKQCETNPLEENHFSYLNNYVVFNAHNSYHDYNSVMTNDVQLIYAALADIAYENGLREDYYGNRSLDGYYFVSQPFGESNALLGNEKGLCGLVDGVDGYSDAQPFVSVWLESAMKRTGISVDWKKDIDDPYFAMAICIIRMAQTANGNKSVPGKSLEVFQDKYNMKARNAERWRISSKDGVISDEDGQFRYYKDDSLAIMLNTAVGISPPLLLKAKT